MQDEQPTISKTPLLIAGGVFLIILGVFIYEFITLSNKETAGIHDEADITETSYLDVVTPLLANADAGRGAETMVRYGCTACHGNSLAPDIPIIMENASTRRPPMTASAYIYESIMHPGAYIVEGFQNNMPRIYGETVNESDLGDIIAYLSGFEFDETSYNESNDQIIIDDGFYPLTQRDVNEYEGVAEFLLIGADPKRGEILVEENGCNVCHGEFSAGILAPDYAETALYASERRPPLSAAAYVYEAIIYPGRYITEGWDDTMLPDYDDLIGSNDLGDMIAYILNQ
jgi:cytochrome c